MPAERAPMRKVREVLRLKHAVGASEREIAVSVGSSRSTVAEYLRRAAVVGITWPVPAGMDDAELERRLFTPASFAEHPARALADWNRIHTELKRRGVTLLLLWEEYRAEHPDGYGYSRFCDLYRDWRSTISATMRQTHGPAEKLFVDFAGDTVAVFDAVAGEQRLAQVFVAVLGASNRTFAQARWTQGLPDWIGAHIDALADLGGVPKSIVCDNLKAGVTVACRYEPGINRTYQELAEHYGTVILPARPRKPRDKAKVEAAVLIVERYVLARLRNRRFSRSSSSTARSARLSPISMRRSCARSA
jgi:transposase